MLQSTASTGRAGRLTRPAPGSANRSGVRSVIRRLQAPESHQAPAARDVRTQAFNQAIIKVGAPLDA
jgi:hypothetical protein